MHVRDIQNAFKCGGLRCANTFCNYCTNFFSVENDRISTFSVKILTSVFIIDICFSGSLLFCMSINTNTNYCKHFRFCCQFKHLPRQQCILGITSIYKECIGRYLLE